MYSQKQKESVESVVMRVLTESDAPLTADEIYAKGDLLTVATFNGVKARICTMRQQGKIVSDGARGSFKAAYTLANRAIEKRKSRTDLHTDAILELLRSDPAHEFTFSEIRQFLVNRLRCWNEHVTRYALNLLLENKTIVWTNPGDRARRYLLKSEDEQLPMP